MGLRTSGASNPKQQQTGEWIKAQHLDERCSSVTTSANEQLGPVRVKIHRSTDKPPTAGLPPKADVPGNAAIRRICAKKSPEQVQQCA
jgi:hypothetical protein